MAGVGVGRCFLVLGGVRLRVGVGVWFGVCRLNGVGVWLNVCRLNGVGVWFGGGGVGV
jgi:hypothetical protein